MLVLALSYEALAVVASWPAICALTFVVGVLAGAFGVLYLQRQGV